MASPSPILSYADNVVATYDPSSLKADYQNVNVNNNVDITNDLTVNGSTVLAELTVAGYKLPVSGYSPLADDDYMAYDSTANGGAGGFIFKNFSTAGVTINNVGDLVLPATKSNGTILHMASSASQIVADPSSEYTIIDGKSPALINDLKLSDRMLVSVDKPGTGTSLYKLTLSNLFKFIENSTTSMSIIKSSASNTAVDAKDTTIDLIVDDGITFLNRVSTLANTGMTLHGNLFFNTDSDLGANASLEVIGNGFLLRRFADSLSVEVGGTQNLVVNNTDVQIGSAIDLQASSFLDLQGGSGIDLQGGSQINMTNGATVVLDQSLQTTDTVTFDVVNANTVNSVDVLSSNNVTSTLDLNSGRDVLAGRDISAGRDIIAGNTIFTTTAPVVTSSIAYKENIKTFENGLSYIMNMKPVQYDRKNNSSKNEIGFIAEDMETVLPTIVKSGYGLKGIQYDQIVPVLVSALQEQQKKIEELEKKVK